MALANHPTNVLIMKMMTMMKSMMAMMKAMMVIVIKPGDLSVLPLSDFAPLWLVMPVPVCLSL